MNACLTKMQPLIDLVLECAGHWVRNVRSKLSVVCGETEHLRLEWVDTYLAGAEDAMTSFAELKALIIDTSMAVETLVQALSNDGLPWGKILQQERRLDFWA